MAHRAKRKPGEHKHKWFKIIEPTQAEFCLICGVDRKSKLSKPGARR